MSNIKLIALDLDGTMLTSDKIISPKTLDALEKAASLGIEIVPCTGRFYQAMPECVKSLPFVKYSINSNGANIYDVKNDKTISDTVMDIDTSLELIKYIRTLHVAFDSYIDNWGYMESEYYDNISDYMENPFYIKNIIDYRKKVPSLDDYIAKNCSGVQKIQFFAKDPSIIIAGSEYIASHFPNCIVTSAGIDDSEINDINATKGNALEILANKLGIGIDQTMAFGDSGNDVSMIQQAGIGVAMGNARDTIKQAAKFVTLSNNDDGVAFALEKFVFDA